jgi:hypothetical protein
MVAKVDGPSSKPPLITKAEFNAWLRSQSVNGTGILWICEYTGAILTIDSVEAHTGMMVMHRLPPSRGGETEIANLVICSRHVSYLRRNLSEETWRALWSLLGTIDPQDAREIRQRLAVTDIGVSGAAKGHGRRARAREVAA